MRWIGSFAIIALTASWLALGSVSAEAPRLGAAAPEVTGERWINSEPLTTLALRGRVVLVEFWTYG